MTLTAWAETPPVDGSAANNEDGPVGKDDSVVQTLEKGVVTNYMYGYSVRIPASYQNAFQSGGIHGFTIVLDADAGAKIVVYAGFDSSSTLDTEAAHHIQPDDKEPPRVLLNRVATRLGGAPATRLTLRPSSTEGASPLLIVVAALRHDSASRSGEGYSATLHTSESRYDRDKKVFDEFLRSWRLLPRPAVTTVHSKARNMSVRIPTPTGWIGAPTHNVRHDSFGWSHGDFPAACYLSIQFDPYTEQRSDPNSDDIVIRWNSTPLPKIREQYEREFKSPQVDRVATLKVTGQAVRVHAVYDADGHFYAAQLVHGDTVISLELRSSSRRELHRHKTEFLALVRSLRIT